MDARARYNFGGSAAGNPLLPVSAFSAYSLLRNYNLLSAPTEELHLKHLRNHSTDLALQSPPILDDHPAFSCQDSNKNYISLPGQSFLANSHIFNYSHHLNLLQNEPFSNSNSKRRCEKKPIPDEQKDDKYFERRKRNNQAAKKSRDARKIREDKVALRATILEHENALLRAQVLTLKEEASSLRQMLLHKKTLELT
ncbi:unnamed protein product [Brassicogethes aeneus]|uniref:BZIP domain-containing protein n=1 Tax=Brassicogethes aeneus TaxID=1431903 RepID=A0A9P0BAX4_BRAAE|nr:unnamed protein product [Brassicogethes aeneus]